MALHAWAERQISMNTTKVQVRRVEWGPITMTIGVNLLHNDKHVPIYNTLMRQDDPKAENSIAIANSTAMCIVMALEAVNPGINVEIETLD
jgi:hypothetical protein